MVYPELAHLGLVVSRGGEDLRLLGGDGGVAVDEAREDAAQGLYAAFFLGTHAAAPCAIAG